MTTHTEARAVARALSATNDIRSHITRAASACRHAGGCPVADVPGALAAAELALENAYEAAAYVAAELTTIGDN